MLKSNTCVDGIPLVTMDERTENGHYFFFPSYKHQAILYYDVVLRDKHQPI